MAKNKKKEKKSKANRGQRRQRPPPAMPRLTPLSLIKQTCSLSNPFCMEAVGARWPDDSYTKSIGWSITGRNLMLSTGTTGTVTGRLCVGDLYNNAIPTNADPITTGPLTYTTFGQASTIPTGVVRYRITSWGLRISSTVAPLYASGMVRVRLMSPMTGATLLTVDESTVMADEKIDIPLARLANEDLFVIPAPLGSDARLFRDTINYGTSDVGTWLNPGWQVVNVAVTGAPVNSSVLQVSYYCNYEFVFGEGDASTAFAQPPPANNPAVQAASAGTIARVGNFFEGTLGALDKVFQSRAGQFLVGAGLSYATKSPMPLLTAGSRLVD